MAFGNLGNWQSIPSTLVGGSVVTILARQAIRSAALQQQQAFAQQVQGLSAPVYNPPTVWIAAVPVSVRTQEAYSYQADVTILPLESGAITTDHVILHPIRLDLSFEITNWNPALSKYSLELLDRMWKERQPISLQTEHRQFDNMILSGLQSDNSVPNWGGLSFRATFTQINFITVKTVKYPVEKVTATASTGGPDVSKSVQSEQDTGQQTPQTSILIDLFSGN